MKSNIELEYFKNIIDTVTSKEIKLKEQVFHRDENTCVLCFKQTEDVSLLTLHCLDDNEPTLHNTITVCRTCKTRVIKDNQKRFNMIFSPYLRSNKIKEFNNTTLGE